MPLPTRRLSMMVLVSVSACGDSAGSGRAVTDAGVIEVPAAQATPLPDGLCTSCDACEEKVSLTSAQHVSGDLSYGDPPPAGGDHNPCWAPWGVHDELVPDERWVHNLEHGGVIFLYHCEDDCPSEVEMLADFVADREQALLTPYPKLGARFAAVAWGVRLVSDCFDVQAFADFYDHHVDHAPESVQSGPPPDCL